MDLYGAVPCVDAFFVVIPGPWICSGRMVAAVASLIATDGGSNHIYGGITGLDLCLIGVAQHRAR